MPRISKPRSKTDAAVRRRLANNLCKFRKKAKLTQEEAAHKSGLSVAHYQMVEYGRINITLGTLSKLSEGLSVDVAILFKKRVS